MKPRGNILSNRIVISVFVISVLLLPTISFAADCTDHRDNNGDGYCDVMSRTGYCEDGSRLGDPNCLNADSTESVCIPTTEVCNGVDDNCNGQIDEGLMETQTCGSNVGECTYGTQTRTCDVGDWTAWSACTGGIVPAAEVCNDDKDNDCDGIVDDGCGITGQIIDQTTTILQTTTTETTVIEQSQPHTSTITTTVRTTQRFEESGYAVKLIILGTILALLLAGVMIFGRMGRR